MNLQADVIVVGGGLHGLSSALQLARRGAKVSLLEGDWIGRHASSATAAGVRTMNRDFRELDIALESIQMWHNMTQIVDDDCGFHANGQLSVAENEEGLAKLNDRCAQTHALGYAHEQMLSQNELRDLVPALSSHCLGALYVAHDGAADPHRTIKAFRASCVAAGVKLHEQTQVQALERCGNVWKVTTNRSIFKAPQIVNATGAWAAALAGLAGETIPLGYKASMMIVTEKLTPFLPQVISGFGRNLTFKQAAQGGLVIGGGLQGRADVANKLSWVDYQVLARSARAVIDLFPQLGSVQITRCWTGIEAKTIDLLPVIDRSAVAEGLWHVFGFSGHGFELVPISGVIMADLICEGKTSRNISKLGVKRLQNLV